ncbi:conserved membrane protein [Sulfolobus acidocaldarius DSM 639]|uniref:Conserved membrane protein n=1 Tax=Sulfolobus acidocaldarius (strain ATCC 33909 / DSM 639 / JCM 8929 / NBRC 15157 / NCIMB 11770) TaxID=330779 RepID=Q4JAD6_SULAC|nr:conserved membrane protein [Sulfolobus acidocaldarius DSM 639]
MLIEFLVIIVSYIVLYVVNRENFLIFTFRVLSYVNIFIGLSEKIDYSTIIDTLGSKGVPLVISIAYIPFFYRVSRELIFNMRARKVRFSFSNYVLPLTVQTIKVAEDLYVSYNLKLYGNLIRKRNFKPRKIDILLLIASVSVLLVSCVYNPHFLQIYNFVA